MFLENQSNNKSKRGCIEVICGSMFSGKTEELIRRLKRAEFAKQQVEIFKPGVDIRYDEEDVVSHDKNKINATPVTSSSNIMLLYNDADVVAIDEAQFFDDELPSVCSALANKGVRVIVAGLDMDFKGKPFGPMPNIMAIAEYVTKVHAICVDCGELANFSYRLTDENKTVLLGEKDTYKPLCRVCFDKNKKKAPSGNS